MAGVEKITTKVFVFFLAESIVSKKDVPLAKKLARWDFWSKALLLWHFLRQRLSKYCLSWPFVQGKSRLFLALNGGAATASRTCQLAIMQAA